MHNRLLYAAWLHLGIYRCSAYVFVLTKIIVQWVSKPVEIGKPLMILRSNHDQIGAELRSNSRSIEAKIRPPPTIAKDGIGDIAAAIGPKSVSGQTAVVFWPNCGQNLIAVGCCWGRWVHRWASARKNHCAFYISTDPMADHVRSNIYSYLGIWYMWETRESWKDCVLISRRIETLVIFFFSPVW